MEDSQAQTMTTFLGCFDGARRSVKEVAAYTKQVTDDLKRQSGGGTVVPGVKDSGESIANLMLAYRHLEDASMRIGKAIQAADGGASVYDRATTVGA